MILLLEKTKSNLRKLRMNDMADLLDTTLEKAQEERQGHLEFLSRLVKVQLEKCGERSFERRLTQARLPRGMTFESFDYLFQPGLDVETIKNLSELHFIAQRNPLLILGKPGTGKTHLAVAFGVRACSAGFKVKFFSLQELLAELYSTLADDSTVERIARLTRLDLIIIDGIDHLRGKPEYPGLLFDLIDACQGRSALVITSGISFEEWGAVLGNPTITAAIVDRIFHHAHLINIRQGRSYRTEGPHSPKVFKP